jgi:hypothetical protein
MSASLLSSPTRIKRLAALKLLNLIRRRKTLQDGASYANLSA